jgi:hypothetical protein
MRWYRIRIKYWFTDDWIDFLSVWAWSRDRAIIIAHEAAPDAQLWATELASGI